VLLQLIDDFDGAIRDSSKALRIDPSMASAWNNLATAKRAKGDLKGAIEDFGRALELDAGIIDDRMNREAAIRELVSPEDCEKSPRPYMAKSATTARLKNPGGSNR